MLYLGKEPENTQKKEKKINSYASQIYIQSAFFKVKKKRRKKKLLA